MNTARFYRYIIYLHPRDIVVLMKINKISKEKKHTSTLHLANLHTAFPFISSNMPYFFELTSKKEENYSFWLGI
jgi:hypothetical protein